MPRQVTYPNGETRRQYMARQIAEGKRVRAIPYRETTLCPIQQRDDWLALPPAMRLDPRRY